MTTLHPITIGRARRGLSSPLPGQAYVGRPSPLGNIYQIGPDGTREEVINKCRVWLWEQIRPRPGAAPPSRQLVELLRLLALARAGPLELLCWCAPRPCHAEVIRAALIWLHDTTPA